MRHLVVAILMFLALLWSGAAPAAQAWQEDNLLRNPSFEGGYSSWNGVPEAQVAHEWTPWWIEDTNREPRWHRPEWKRAVRANYPKRVKSGDSAQQYFTFYASHYAGMYQQVFNVTPGRRYQFGLYVQFWSSLEDNPDVSVSPANPHFQIGIDPTGAARPGFAAPPNTVIWSGEAPMNVHVDRWGLMTVEAVAQNSTITVYVRSSPDFANKHNDIYMDDAYLRAVAPAPPPSPPPTNTLDPAAATAAPTDTPLPTATAASTDTPEPTATLLPTETPVPTETALPTDTPAPTETPSLPTATSKAALAPTETAAATAIAAIEESAPPNAADESTAETAASRQNQTPAWISVISGAVCGSILTLILVAGYLVLRRRDPERQR